MRTPVCFVILLGSLLLASPLGVAPAVAEASAISGGMWVSVASLNTARRDSAGVLLDDGRVFVVGGWNAPSLATQPFSSAELYDPVSDTWSYAAPMLTPRTFPTATLLQNGKVLVTGGANSDNDWLSSAELYDPATNSWTPAGNLPVGVYGQSATLLKNGQVLVSGGSGPGNVPTSVVALYNPKSEKWSYAASMTYARTFHTATLLNNGKVLIDGGWAGSTSYGPPEIYDPKANTWTPAGTSLARNQMAATLLPNGNVLVVGGQDASANALSAVEIYNPSTNTWSTGPSMAVPRYRMSAVLLDNGLVLVAGGTNGPPFGFADGLSAVELYNPTTNTWTTRPSLPVGTNWPVVATLRCGYVLFAGGDDNGGLAATQLYVPAPF